MGESLTTRRPGPSPAVAYARARLAGMHRRARAPGDPEIVDARRELEYVKLVEHAHKIAAELLPLSEDQIEKVVALLKADEKTRAGEPPT